MVLVLITLIQYNLWHYAEVIKPMQVLVLFPEIFLGRTDLIIDVRVSCPHDMVERVYFLSGIL